MLNNVATQINRSARMVTMRHPNAMECDVSRKQCRRLAASLPAEMGGLPTIGGLGVLSGEDESDFEYIERGDAKILFCGIFQGPGGGNWTEHGAMDYQSPPVEAMIECLAEPGTADHFFPDKNDLVMAYPGEGIVLAYEVMGVDSAIGIPPYTRKYLLQPRQDMNVGI